uniref:Uncharacterized protein n=1 Tax=Panagrellus redivivus TaxID=6233 RepID=A0A7E4W1N7_PANRE
MFPKLQTCTSTSSRFTGINVSRRLIMTLHLPELTTVLKQPNSSGCRFRKPPEAHVAAASELLHPLKLLFPEAVKDATIVEFLLVPHM